MTTILLVRHGHVEGIKPQRFRGRAELPLSELGRRQAAALGTYIARHSKPQAIYTSPLGRCRETGAAIGEPLGLQCVPVEAFADIDYGAWQGLTLEDATLKWPQEVATWRTKPNLAVIPGGESLDLVLARTTAALHDLLSRHSRDTIVIVGHDTVNRALLLHALELPLSRYWHIGQEPCAINQLAFEDESFFVKSINETQHLENL